MEKREIGKPRRHWFPYSPKWVRWLAWKICAAVCWLIGARSRNLEAFPKKGPVLVIAPHFTYIDWLFLLGSLPRPSHFIADSFFVFQNPFVAWACWTAGVVPINRTAPDPYCLRQYLRLLSQGEVCVLFPEGARSMEGRVLAPMTQAVKLISKLRVPVAVFALRGAYDVWPRWDPRPRFLRRVTVELHHFYKEDQPGDPRCWKGIYDYRSKVSVAVERDRIRRALSQAAQGEPEALTLNTLKRIKSLPYILCFCPSCCLPDGLEWEETKKFLLCRGCRAAFTIENNLLCLQNGSKPNKKILADWFDEMIRKLIAKNPEGLYVASRAFLQIGRDSAPQPGSLRIDSNGLAVRTDTHGTLRIPVAEAAKASLKGTEVLELSYQGRPISISLPGGNASTWTLLLRKLAGWEDLFSEV